MQKIACIFSFKESNWISCQKIVLNLHKAYQENTDWEILNFNYSDQEENLNFKLLALEIFNTKPDTIVILDHKPHPLYLFSHLLPLYEGQAKPKVIVHIFGDFSLYYQKWEQLAPFLENFDVRFIVASERQKKFIDQFLETPQAEIMPFPIHEEEFFYDEKLRLNQRKEWNLKETEVAFVFTGRLSRQKRIKTLITTFASEFKNEPRAHLFFYGLPDKIGDPFLGYHEIEGEYFRKFYKAYKALPESVQERIHFMGNVPNTELLHVYHGADVLVNLSVHNDEDFGMSVAEAQCTGLASILTDWGGLASFEHPQLKEATQFIPVTIGIYSKVFSREKVQNALRHFFENPPYHLRESLSRAARKRFGIKSSGQRIRKIHEQKSKIFTKFNSLFMKTSLLSTYLPSYNPFLTSQKKLSHHYRELYSAYVRND